MTEQIVIVIFLGLTSKSERAAVGEAAKLWSKVIMGDSSSKALEITLGPEVYNLTALKAKVLFRNGAFKANETVSISCYITNDCSQKDADDFQIPLLGFEIDLRWQNDTKTARTLKKEETVLLGPGVKHLSNFEFLPNAQDVGKKLTVDKIILRLGKANGLNVLVHQIVPSEANEPPLATFFPDLSRMYQLYPPLIRHLKSELIYCFHRSGLEKGRHRRR